MWPVRKQFLVVSILFLILPISGCATTLKLVPDNRVPHAIVSEWAPPEVLQGRVTIKIEAPEIAVARNQFSLKSIRTLEYPARQMLTEVADICAKRWFAEVNIGSGSADLLLVMSIRDLVYDKGTDIHVWYPITEAHVTVNVMDAGLITYWSESTSGKQIGNNVKDFRGQTSVTQEHYTQYTRMVYRALLLAVDKAMVDVILHVPELRNHLSADDKKWLEQYRK